MWLILGSQSFEFSFTGFENIVATVAVARWNHRYRLKCVWQGGHFHCIRSTWLLAGASKKGTRVVKSLDSLRNDCLHLWPCLFYTTGKPCFLHPFYSLNSFNNNPLETTNRVLFLARAFIRGSVHSCFFAVATFAPKIPLFLDWVDGPMLVKRQHQNRNRSL